MGKQIDFNAGSPGNPPRPLILHYSNGKVTRLAETSSITVSSLVVSTIDVSGTIQANVISGASFSGINIEEIDDVFISSPQVSNVIVWDGSNWVNSGIQAIGGGVSLFTELADAYSPLVAGSIVMDNGSNLEPIASSVFPTRVEFEAHEASATVHFIEGQINHLAISNVGTNTHADIDDHIGDTMTNPHGVTLSSLDGVTIVTPANNHFLRHLNGVWESAFVEVSTLGDTAVTGTPAVGQVLAWSAGVGGNTWAVSTVQTGGAGAGALSALADVTITATPTQSQVIAWDIGQESWVISSVTHPATAGNALSGLTDTQVTTTPLNTQALVWSVANEAWQASTVPTTGGAGATTLSGLADTAVTGTPGVGQVLSWSAGVGGNVWAVSTLAGYALDSAFQTHVGDLTNPHGVEASALDDVSITGVPALGQVLAWSAGVGGNVWAVSTIDTGGAGATTLSGLSDTLVTATPLDTQALIWSVANEAWQASTVPTGGTGVTELSSLTDTAVTGTPGVGQILTWSAGVGGNVWAVSTLAGYALDSALTTHTGNDTIHFTEASIEHGAIASTGVNSHVDIDNHINSATVHFLATDVTLSGLNDTNVTGNPGDTQVLAWSVASEAWEPSTVPTGGTGVTELSSLTDTAVTGEPGNGQVLVWSAGVGGNTWAPSSILTLDPAAFVAIAGGTMTGALLNEVLVSAAELHGTTISGTTVEGQLVQAPTDGGGRVDRFYEMRVPSSVEGGITSPGLNRATLFVSGGSEGNESSSIFAALIGGQTGGTVGEQAAIIPFIRTADKQWNPIQSADPDSPGQDLPERVATFSQRELLDNFISRELQIEAHGVRTGSISAFDVSGPLVVYGPVSSVSTNAGFFTEGSVTAQGNIEVVGTVDGRDVAADGTALDNHIASTTVHFLATDVSLSGLSDTTVTGAPGDSQVLVWSAAAEVWTPSSVTHPAAGTDLSGMGDTQITATPEDTQALVWSVANEAWVPSSVTHPAAAGNALSSLTDTAVTGEPGHSQVLVWSAGVGGNVWTPSSVTHPTGSTALSGLSDTLVTATPLDTQALIWSVANEAWQASTVPTGGTGVSELSGLTDTAVTGEPGDGQILVWSAGVGGNAWTPSSVDILPSGTSLSGLTTDVTITGAPGDSQVLVWSAAAEVWTPSSVTHPAAGGNTLSGHTDTNVTGNPGDSQVLSWSVANEAWEPSTVSILPSGTALSGLNSDVTITGAPGDSQVLVWSAAAEVWTPSSVTHPPGGSNALSGHTDTNVTGNPGDTQVLAWSIASEAWEPSTVPTGGTGVNELSALNDTAVTGEPGNGQVLVWSAGVGGNAWTPSSLVLNDHGQLDGLGDDDHLHYMVTSPATVARGTIDPTGDFPALTIETTIVTEKSDDYFQVIDDPGDPIVRINSAGKLFAQGLDASSQRITNVPNPVLLTDAANYQWVESNSTSSVSGATDTSVTGAPGNSQVLVWSAAAEVWTPSSVLSPPPSGEALSGLTTDVTITGAPGDSQVLVWSAAAEVWTPSSVTHPPGGANALSGHTDTNVTGNPGDSQVLAWSVASEAWEPSSVGHPPAGASNFVELGDAYTPLAANSVVMDNGSNLEPIASSILVETIPDSSTRNKIDPVGDTVALQVSKETGGGTDDMFQALNNAGALVSRIDSAGKGYFIGLDASSQKITNVADPTLNTDAATWSWVTNNSHSASALQTTALLADTPTSGQVIVFSQGGDWVASSPPEQKSITVSGAESQQILTMFYIDHAITVERLASVWTGTSPSGTYEIMHNTDRSAAGNSVKKVTHNNTTTGQIDTTGFTDATIPANSWVWLYIEDAGGTAPVLNVTVHYRRD
jgi:hypothetical protein